MSISFENQVAIVTGAANGLGRSHALELARLGAKVLVNDFGGARDGMGSSLSPAQSVVAEITAAGGEAIANGANVADHDQCEAMVDSALANWGRVDILVNNAGILRDKSFSKMPTGDWQEVVNVHLNGSANCSRAVWNQMKAQSYGRILMTTSTSGIYGNFGQANYGAAKLGLIGLMNTLCIEGEKYNINVNCLSPTAATRMTEDVLTTDMLTTLDPKYVSPAALFLVCKNAPTRCVMLAGAGTYSTLQISESSGVNLPADQRNVDGIADNFSAISDMSNPDIFFSGTEHVLKAVAKGG
ncbi:MAG: SDR family NAD(P)-dependent oxidoreductase [Granulosicoccus sp.]